VELAKKALSLDESNALPHTLFSLVSAETGDFETANREAKKALALEPNNADSNFIAALIYGFQGRYDESAERWDKALLLFPLSRYYHSLASVHYFYAGSYQKAIATAKEAIKQKQQFSVGAYLALVASYSSLGRQEEARTAADEFRKINPKFSLAEWKKGTLARGSLPYLSANTKYRATIDRLEEALRKGGLE
jgi:tetratricopeptide (TPR) repeat protein